MNFKEWTLIDWDGNPAMKLKCWRKSFRCGHVSVGVGDFLTVGYSYGPNSDSSGSSTRWRKDRIISEIEMMKLVDQYDGRFNWEHYANTN